MIQAPHYQRQINTEGLAKLLKFKTGAKVMLTVNVDIQNQTGNIKHTKLGQGSVLKVYMKIFDEQAAFKATRSSYLGTQSFWVNILKCETKIPIKKESASPSIKCTQFPLTLAQAATVHKVQGLSLEQGDFDLQKQKLFEPGQTHVAVSRPKT